MSININRKITETTTDNHTYRIKTVLDQDPYWDEGLKFYPTFRKGFKNANKQILEYQKRSYRSWKHNRLKQYKF